MLKFDGKNYFLWEFHFRNFAKEKELRCFIDGSNTEPEDSKEVTKWKDNNVKFNGWILSSIEPHISLTHRPYTTAQDIMVQFAKSISSGK